MTLDHRQQAFAPVRSALDLAVHPIRQSVNLPSEVSGYVSESLRSNTSLQDELQRLRTQLLLQSARLQKLEALERENIRLRSLLDSSFEIGERVTIAKLVKVALDPYKHLVIINRGSWDEVYLHQPVLDAHGVVGQVMRVAPKDSQVILISDPSHAIPVQINRTGMRTIAFGSGKINRLELPYIPNNSDVREGDLLVTSGLGGIFPAGYPVGVITSATIDPGRPFAQVSAEPAAKLDRVREVMLVWRKPPDTETELIDNDLPSMNQPEDAP